MAMDEIVSGQDVEAGWSLDDQGCKLAEESQVPAS
jgi:hypothetical protein